MRHQKLGQVHVRDTCECSQVVICCPLLEHLDLVGIISMVNCLDQLNSTCPILKRLKVDMSAFQGEPLSIFLENVEEMMMSNLTRAKVRLDCPKLTNLCVSYTFLPEVLLKFMAHCPKLKDLRVTGYNQSSVLSSFLNFFSLLESLNIERSSIEGENLDLVHPHIQEVGFTNVRMRQKVVLSIPHLENLYIFESNICKLTATSNKSVTLEPSSYEGSSPRGVKKVWKRGESVTLGIRHDKNMLGVVHGDDTFWMEHNKGGW